MSAFALEETLEADWVAVRPHAFQEREKHKFVFIVAWNEIEGKFAITCHNRTAQRQRGGSREPTPRPGGAAGRGAEPGPPRGRDEAAARGAGSPARRRGPAAACGPEDIEVLEPGKEEGAAGPPPSEPTVPDAEPVGEECSWAGLFSFQDLRAVHQQLCSVNSELEPYLPAFPEEPSGMWTVLFGAPELSEQEMDALCCKLQGYLVHSLDTCGWKILSQILFAETDDPEEYYESLSELRQKGYEEVLQRARRRIQELLEKHKNTESMVELLELYQMEDEAYSSLAEATTELYQYLLQPFRDMRELAMLRRQQIKISIENDYLGPRRIESLQKEDADWQRKAHMAVLSIQDLTVKYFEITAKTQKAVYDRMRADQKKFGKAAWAAAVERMEKLQYAVSKETLQLMRAKEICLEQKKHALKEEEICIAKHSEKIQQRHQSVEECKMHHAVQLKRDQLQDEEERKSSWVSQERQKTLDRLRTFKQRYPGQVILKSTRLRLAHARRKCAASSVSCVDQPQSLPATIQTQEKSEDVELENAVKPLQVQESTGLEQHQDISLPPTGVTSELPQVGTSTLTTNELQPETVTVVPLPPPLPPPPPPPPLPSKEDATKSLEKNDSIVKRQSEEKGVQHSSGFPPAHLFDSSQLVSAKKKLKKTGDLESLQRRRVSSPMDEVLASLKRGSFHLRKVEQRSLPPFPDEDDSNNILAQIRKGVKLKKVQKDVLKESFTILPDTDPLTRSIHEALRRIKEASPESEDEEESLPCTDWEN
ncbi:junction-mediating and -regulatory protein isoform X2 [Cuculus canorus]|uniref:junction-mediating and -regulatory protein isoform X2 n=1 Tax=Cuculus canorus TaxID=55661 RepID=UPI0023AA6855|nr:junction-mediating and -regulatory protein isoform X2 [Cuculus canorus]